MALMVLYVCGNMTETQGCRCLYNRFPDNIGQIVIYTYICTHCRSVGQELIKSAMESWQLIITATYDEGDGDVMLPYKCCCGVFSAML
jgi:hypothetical protein